MSFGYGLQDGKLRQSRSVNSLSLTLLMTRLAHFLGPTHVKRHSRLPYPIRLTHCQIATNTTPPDGTAIRHTIRYIRNPISNSVVTLVWPRMSSANWINLSRSVAGVVTSLAFAS